MCVPEVRSALSSTSCPLVPSVVWMSVAVALPAPPPPPVPTEPVCDSPRLKPSSRIQS